jgi:phytoene synthase
MIDKAFYSIFKRGSRTFFYTSRAFPDEIKGDVFILYSFVRKSDDYVDVIPQRVAEFCAFKDRFEKGLRGIPTRDRIIDSFIDLMHRRKFHKAWIQSFLGAMEMDITKSEYATVKEVEKYMYGSAEVVGLMMARIMNLSVKAYDCARYLGRAMQYINFIRDIKEDLRMGRTYLPRTQLKKHQLISLQYPYVRLNRVRFCRFMRTELARFKNWQKKAERGFRFIPDKYLVSIKTASEMYEWTARQIKKDPFIVYRKKVKPTVSYIKQRLDHNRKKLL